ncbi:DUF1188 domain-containing protein [Methanothermobacter sp.]|uniref:DUF1188 domain-containing protein n=1 Tax=Methanothermobacter sp. TaxID=1884223 RepID=UPI002619F1E6|nr:DUF1188 domain-containing protein [Methanothermobacter sp.]MDI9614926.1 DUF1188 domain-containing protein [Methanothermobacter sp.]
MKHNETGITETVKTFFSTYRVYDIIKHISTVKSTAVIEWLTEIDMKPERALIIGSYFTGAAIAGSLDCDVTVADINPQTRFILDDSVKFHGGVRDLRGHWDLLVDTTGLGGVTEDEMRGITAEAFIVEDPTSDGSDETIRRFNRTYDRLRMVESDISGALHTDGIGAKTSGTMTLTVEVMRRSMADALEFEGVLYATATLEFFERILFKEGDPERFLRRLESPSLVVSSLEELDCDGIIEGNLGMIKSRIIPE